MNSIRTPEIVTYLHEALPLAVLPETREHLPWFCGNYIQLIWLSNNSQVALDFYMAEPFETIANPWLETRLVSSDMLNWFGTNPETFVMRTIDNGFSLYLGLDEYYIPESLTFGSRHNNHANLIYGYNSDECFFNVVGYNRVGEYRAYALPFDRFVLAFENLDFQQQGAVRMVNLIRFDKHKDQKQAVNRNLDLGLVTDYLTDYLESRNSSYRLRKLQPPIEGVYGVAIYDKLVAWVESLDSKQFVDHRRLRLLWEHKKCMLTRLDYFRSQGILPSDFKMSDYRDVERSADRARLQLIKFSLTGNLRLNTSIINEIDYIRKQELRILPSVLAHVEASYGHAR